VTISPREAPLSRPLDSEPATIMTAGAPSAPALSDVPGADVPAASGPASEHEVLDQRMRAIAELSGGQIGHAVHVLRAAHARLQQAGASPSSLCQASLVLAVALAHWGHADEALLQGLDALARAREGDDRPGEHACVTFLAKLFEGTSHEAEAKKLRAKALVGAVHS
jgi:hypothetical protein